MAKPILTDELSELIEPLLPHEPPKRKGGRPRIPTRAALTGILFVFKTGIHWDMVPDHPFTQLEVPRAVSRDDRGVIVDVHVVEGPGYEVEFFDADANTVDLLTLAENEIEPYK